MKITSPKLIRWAGLAAMGAGIIYITIQAIHPLDVLSSVTTARWVIVHYLSIVMDILAMLGIAGIYARQVEKSGWLGLAGYLVFSGFWAFSVALHFIEAFISPVVANVAPKFVEGLFGMVNGARHRDEPRCTPNRIWATRARYVCARRTPAVWHRYVPRWHPAALGRWTACRWGPYCPSFYLQWFTTHSIGYLQCR